MVFASADGGVWICITARAPAKVKRRFIGAGRGREPFINICSAARQTLCACFLFGRSADRVARSRALAEAAVAQGVLSSGRERRRRARFLKWRAKLGYRHGALAYAVSRTRPRGFQWTGTSARRGRPAVLGVYTKGGPRSGPRPGDSSGRPWKVETGAVLYDGKVGSLDTGARRPTPRCRRRRSSHSAGPRAPRRTPRSAGRRWQ